MKIFIQKIATMPRRKECMPNRRGLPMHGHARLG